MRQTREVRTGVPKSTGHVILSLGVSVPLSLLETKLITSLVKDDHYELSGNINKERALPDYFLYGGGPLS